MKVIWSMILGTAPEFLLLQALQRCVVHMLLWLQVEGQPIADDGTVEFREDERLE
jgi:hypothetical protein